MTNSQILDVYDLSGLSCIKITLAHFLQLLFRIVIKTDS